MKKTVLVVEDDAAIRMSIVDVLSDVGYPTLTASNGQEGLSVLRASNPQPGLVLLDITMPILDGYGFRQQQLLDPMIAQVPTAMISADGRLPDKAMRAQAAEYLKKPVDLEVLVALVQKYCG